MELHDDVNEFNSILFNFSLIYCEVIKVHPELIH